MLALVTCHIFPSQSDTENMNSWHLTSRLTARSFSESTASRVRSGRCPRQCATLLHGQMYLQEKTHVLQFGHTLEQNSSICPIISYLWMVDLVMRFFSCGASLWRSSTRIRPKKRSSPLDFIFDTCASASSSHLFLVGEAEHVCLYPFARTTVFSAKKICVLQFGRVDTKFLNSSHHVLSVDDWPGDATFFPVGQPLKIIRTYSVKKKVQPLGFYFWHLRLGLFKSLFFGWWSWTCVFVPFCKDNCVFSKKMCFAIWVRVDTKFLNSSHHVVSVDDWPGDAIFFLCGQPLKIIHKNSAKKKVQPLRFYFWPLRLGLLKSLFWLVKVNIFVCTLLQNHVKNHTHSINHGTFFPRVWHLDMF